MGGCGGSFWDPPSAGVEGFGKAPLWEGGGVPERCDALAVVIHISRRGDDPYIYVAYIYMLHTHHAAVCGGCHNNRDYDPSTARQVLPLERGGEKGC